MGKDDLTGNIQTNRPCPSSAQIVNQLHMLKMLDRNTEILPDTTVTNWLAFTATTWPFPGVWKLAIYEVPVATNDDGGVTKTTRFEVRNVVKKYVDTFQQDSPFSEKKTRVDEGSERLIAPPRTAVLTPAIIASQPIGCAFNCSHRRQVALSRKRAPCYTYLQCVICGTSAGNVSNSTLCNLPKSPITKLERVYYGLLL